MDVRGVVYVQRVICEDDCVDVIVMFSSVDGFFVRFGGISFIGQDEMGINLDGVGVYYE